MRTRRAYPLGAFQAFLAAGDQFAEARGDALDQVLQEKREADDERNAQRRGELAGQHLQSFRVA